MISVLVAHDQALVRGGLRLMVEAHDDLHVVGEARDGREAVERALLHRPDVVLMDIRMPGMDGIEATQRILARAGHELRVLLLTTFDLDEYLVRGLRAGASAFLLKTVSPAALADAVRTVHGGGALVDPAVMQRVIAAYVEAPRVALDAPVALRELTDRERDVLRLVARGLSNAEIADRLTIAPATAKTHVGRVLSKLGLRDRVQAVVLAYETGLARAGESPDAGGLSRP